MYDQSIRRIPISNEDIQKLESTTANLLRQLFSLYGGINRLGNAEKPEKYELSLPLGKIEFYHPLYKWCQVKITEDSKCYRSNKLGINVIGWELFDIECFEPPSEKDYKAILRESDLEVVLVPWKEEGNTATYNALREARKSDGGYLVG